LGCGQPEGIMRALLFLIDGLARVLLSIAGILLVALIGTTLYEVISRYVFNAPTIWAFDVAYLINGALFLLAAAYTLKVDGHVTIDVFSARLPGRIQRLVRLLFYVLLFLPAVGIIALAATERSWDAYVTDERVLSAWRPLIWPFYLSIAIGLIAIWLQAFALCLRLSLQLAGRDGGLQAPTAASEEFVP
jgi:TRAP-type mannitol/chloroaromatic compound transport system permease small subunit